jgi:hypothetical protein
VNDHLCPQVWSARERIGSESNGMELESFSKSNSRFVEISCLPSIIKLKHPQSHSKIVRVEIEVGVGLLSRTTKAPANFNTYTFNIAGLLTRSH